MNDDAATSLWCASCCAITRHAVHADGGWVCTTESEDRCCGTRRTWTVAEDGYGVGPLGGAA